MINDSIRTVFKKPKMIVGFMIPLVLLAICYAPSFINEYAYGYSQSVLDSLGSVLLLIFCAIFSQFIFFPALYNYIYEVTHGIEEAGWIKRGLKRNWWKIFTTTLITMVPFYIIYFISFAIFIYMLFADVGSMAGYIVLGTVFILSAIVFYSFSVIAMVTVAAEEKFGTGLKNAFRIGIKNFLKVSLVYFILIAIGAAIGYAWTMIEIRFYRFFMVGIDAAEVIICVLIALAALVLTGIVSAFVFVYINKLYIARLPILQEKDAAKLQSQQAEPEPAQE